ncbi:probable transmembrane GTPase FZO-like, chloroplastic [Papaver somniferum]|uniref:probable transmembrane GTPase FZO-like, chloroplastic n=1 Tax=Papaver somniferum TaxID=3469 RepID=UPI000E6F8400|nr:probable transmembrane GTPase FZO-like, chloroplastic [Papaver somniferum]
MVSLLSNTGPVHLTKLPLLSKTLISNFPHYDNPLLKLRGQRSKLSINSIGKNAFQSNQQQPPRTLFPGGFKRPEIKIPTLILQLSTEDVLRKGEEEEVLNLIDIAVSKLVGIVILDDSEGNGNGGRFYEAARLLKSVIRDRAFLLIAERVDIASAVGASGVVLSDQGLPAIVARNMMMESKSDNTVILPLVGRCVNTADAALSASNSEGADFLIYLNYRGNNLDTIFQTVKVPVFATFGLKGEQLKLADASKLFQSGAGGLVVSLDDLKLLSDDALRNLFTPVSNKTQDDSRIMDRVEQGKNGVIPSIDVDEKEAEFIEMEKIVLQDAISIIQKAAPLMEEVSLLIDAVSRLDEPFLLVIVGEFNSGKSTVINALLGRRYLKEGVVPTTNEITLLCYAEMDTFEQERCERHPDGQFICYLPAPFLKKINLVDTPGTNVILQRQQRLTEEFVPRSDLVVFVISADRPLTASEVAFLSYIQQWKKRVVFVLNKCDLYQSNSELEEAIAFIKENIQKLMNTEHVILYPVAARSAIQAKLSVGLDGGKNNEELLGTDTRWMSSGFDELEKFLFSFLDRSTDAGMDRMRLKLETPIRIADRLIIACETLVMKERESAIQDLASVNEIVGRAKDYAEKMEYESMSWKRQTSSLIEAARARIVRLIESTLLLSNFDLVASYVFKREKFNLMPVSSRAQSDIIDPAISDAQKLLEEYKMWLQSNSSRERMLYNESLEKRWPPSLDQHDQPHFGTHDLQKREDLSVKPLENFSASAAAKLFDQEIREVVLGTFGGLGAAGLSASLLTTVLPTTMEDLLALGLCSAGGFLAVSNLPTRRKEMAEKVRRTADAVARELEEDMRKDLLQNIEDLDNFVKSISKPYQDAAQQRIESLSKTQEELTGIQKKLQNLQFKIQNLHVS